MFLHSSWQSPKTANTISRLGRNLHTVRENRSTRINETLLITLGQFRLAENASPVPYSWAPTAASGTAPTTEERPAAYWRAWQNSTFLAFRAQLPSLKIPMREQQKTLLLSKVPALLVSEHRTQHPALPPVTGRPFQGKSSTPTEQGANGFASPKSPFHPRKQVVCG